MKTTRLILALAVLITSASCSNVTDDLKKAIDTCNAELDYQEATKSKNGISFHGLVDRCTNEARILEMALRRDSCYDVPEVEPLLPVIANIFKRSNKINMESWERNLAHATEYSRYTMLMLIAQENIRLCNQSIAYSYTLNELDSIRNDLDKSIAFLKKDLIASDETVQYINLGEKARQKLADRRIEILSENLYHSNLFPEIVKNPGQF